MRTDGMGKRHNSGPSAASNQLSGAEAMVRMLEAYGVRHIFGLCGDTTLPFYDALYRLDHGIHHILTRDERSAAYMADAYARVSGRVGICEGPSGGGATYIAPGLVEANESSVPILAITTDVSVSSRGHFPLTELDQEGLFRPLTKWNGVIPRAEMLPDMVRQAFRAMTTGVPGSAHLGLPFDVQKASVAPEAIWGRPELGIYPAWRSGPDPQAITAAVERLLAARCPVVICGGGVVLSGAEVELESFARRLDLPVATTISGQGSLPESQANCLGVVGSNGGTPATRAVVDEADLVLFIGCRAGSVTTERWRSPKGGVGLIHIDSNPMVISASYQTDVAVVSDARLALAALNEELVRREAEEGADKRISFGGQDRVRAAKEKKAAAFRSLAVSSDLPIRPERVIDNLNRLLPKDAVVVADPGTPCPYFSAYYEVRQAGRQFFSNRAHGALGYALSAAVGASFGRPGVKVVSAMGDGSFGFTCGELETVVRYGLPITFLVFSNASYGWIKAGQKSGFDERYYSVDFDRSDHARIAEAFGLKAWRVEDPAQLEPTLREALTCDGPSLVDIVSQPLQDAAAPVSEWVA
ncbi:MAG: thiamine pyrophosphate-binding protein [Pseudomonadota bacterium]